VIETRTFKVVAQMRTHTSKPVVGWSLAISALAITASILGLTAPEIYGEETKNWALQAKGQDLGNLIAVVALVWSAYRYRQGSYRAGLVWLGTVFYLVYAYTVYSVAVHFNQLFLVYVAVLGLSAWAALLFAKEIRSQACPPVRGRPRKLAGYTLMAIGVLFALLWLGELIPALLDGRVPQSVIDAGLWVNPIHVIDLAVVLPGFILAGYWTLKRREAGLFLAGPWLVFSVLMGTSIVAAMALMTVEGFESTVPPMIMVSVVVTASVVAAWRYLGQMDSRVLGQSVEGIDVQTASMSELVGTASPTCTKT
jgi:hypothetical protein